MMSSHVEDIGAANVFVPFLKVIMLSAAVLNRASKAAGDRNRQL